MVGRITDRRVATYGFSPQADVQGRNLRYENGGAVFDVALNAEKRTIEGVTLPMTGDHNVSNALAAIAVARHLGVPPTAIKAALAAFGGVNRRFTKVGVWNGVTIIDDYGHHPVEIAAVLKAARQATKGRVIAVHQPHRYTRLRDLFTQFCACFNDADMVAIADVYSAGEAPIEGISRDTLVGGLIAHGHRAGAAAGRRGGAGGLRPRRVPAGRPPRLPRRRLDQRLGERAAGAAERGEPPQGAGGRLNPLTFGRPHDRCMRVHGLCMIVHLRNRR